MTFLSQNRHLKPRDWRNYQADLRRRGNRPPFLWTVSKIALGVLVVTMVGYGLVQGTRAFLWGSPGPDTVKKPQTQPPHVIESAQNLASILSENRLVNVIQPRFTVDVGGVQCQVQTSIDPNVQGPLLSEIESVTARERYRSRYIGIVAMEPGSGRILAMVSFDKDDPFHNTCVDNRFPAASIFKIVTAAAAIELGGLNAESPLAYNGQKYTLYRSQIKTKTNRYTQTLSLRESFAQSVNPVFGKLGAHLLGKEDLEAFADRFGFNQPLAFDIPVGISHVAFEDDPYQLAEIASGFNKHTTISPLHGAIIASPVLNDGHIINPSVVDKIVDPKNRIVYERGNGFTHQVISKEATIILRQLMMATVSGGTARKIFKGKKRHQVLQDLTIGGKTGSINNNPRYDWFIGFAQDPQSGRSLIVSAVVAHEKYIGKKAGEYARLAMESYFSQESKIADTATTSPRG